VPAVKAGISAAGSAIEGAASDAMAALDTSWDFSWLGLGSSDDADGSSSGLLGSLGSLANLGTGSSSSSDFADASQGEAYLAWKALVGDPVGAVLEGSGVSRSVLEGAAGGSTSASEVLASLDEAALTTISSNAANYASTAGSAAVSGSLPSDVRASMFEAESAAQSFAADVQNLVSGVRSVKSGNLLGTAGLVSSANAVVSDLNRLDSCLAAAEAGLK
jgi:hypothetical protein